MCPACFPQSILPTDASLSSTGSSGESSPASTVLSKRYDFLLPISPRFVSFAWRYLGCTRSLSLPGGQVHRLGLELVTRCLRPGCCRGDSRISQVPGEPQSSVCTCSKPTPAGLLAPDPYSAATWPLVIRRQRLPRLGLSTLNSMAFGFAVYASQDRSPGTTQNSLPVAGQALLDGVFTRKVPMKGFKGVIYISFPFPKLCLAQPMQPP